MTKVSCNDCRHYRRAPYEAPKTGCWHPDHMVVSQKERFLDQQQTPGDPMQLNLRGDCKEFEARPPKPGLWKRLLGMGTR
jgi:hypothetical protein